MDSVMDFDKNSFFKNLYILMLQVLLVVFVRSLQLKSTSDKVEHRIRG